MPITTGKVLLYIGLIAVLGGIVLENYFLPAAGVVALVASAWLGTK